VALAGLRLAAHQRQAAPVRRHQGNALFVKFQQHPAQGVTRAFHVRRKNGATDHLPQQPRRHDM
jgi:hypothetical protein